MSHDEHTQPNMAWYIATSLARQVLPRCPFATVDKCPRNYQSVLVVAMSGRSTDLDPDDNQRLFEKWKKTDVWPAVEEDATASSGGTRGQNAFSNICPEVSFERFGWFASQLIGYHDEAESESAQRRLVAELAAKYNADVDLVNTDDNPDWRWAWKSLAPSHYTECPLYAPIAKGIREIVGERKRPVGFAAFQQAQTGESGLASDFESPV